MLIGKKGVVRFQREVKSLGGENRERERTVTERKYNNLRTGHYLCGRVGGGGEIIMGWARPIIF